MTELSIPKTFDQAMLHYQANELPQAESLCRQIISRQPDQGDALHLLGILESTTGRKASALQWFLRAVQAAPRRAEFFCNLGICLSDLGRKEEAMVAFRQALVLNPNFVEALNCLGSELQAKGQIDAAVECFQRALSLRRDYASALNNLGVARQHQGQMDEAIAAFRQALTVHPGFSQAMANLGGLLAASNQTEEAIALLRKAVEILPTSAMAYNNLGIAYRESGRVDEAIAACRQSISLEPDSAAAHNNLGNVLKDTAQWSLAQKSYRRAMELDPRQPAWHSNLIAAMNYSQENSAMMAEELALWNRQHGEAPAGFILPHENDRSSDRRLKIGYVSSDLRLHPVGRFLLPLFAKHDHEKYEIFCYAGVYHPDAITDRLRGKTDCWRDVRGVTDQLLADQIRQDRIDILVDLSLHTSGNRLQVFARKPAPVQVTYLAYCGSSGLKTMDFRLTDFYLDPIDGDESAYTEKSIRLKTYWCYEEYSEAAEVNNLPALENGYVTFGCFNNYCKVSPAAWDVWIRILQTVANSKLVISCPIGSHRDRMRQQLEKAGVEADRLSFAATVPHKEYFQQYHKIDVAFDPFPYCGGTTTCDALWMGVPVITLKGATAVGRAGVSILSQMNLPELIATNAEQYVQIAAKMAGDLPSLSRMRQGLRLRMKRSPLMDSDSFARDIEAAYREMWHRWAR